MKTRPTHEPLLPAPGACRRRVVIEREAAFDTGQGHDLSAIFWTVRARKFQFSRPRPAWSPLAQQPRREDRRVATYLETVDAIASEIDPVPRPARRRAPRRRPRG